MRFYKTLFYLFFMFLMILVVFLTPSKADDVLKIDSVKSFQIHDDGFNPPIDISCGIYKYSDKSSTIICTQNGNEVNSTIDFENALTRLIQDYWPIIAVLDPDPDPNPWCDRWPWLCR